MVKWLLLLAVTLYAAMLYGGEDRGQLRAGLRPQPAEPLPPPITVTVTEAAAPAPVQRSAAITLVPMLPRPAQETAPVAPQPTQTADIAPPTDATGNQPLGISLLTEDTAAVDLEVAAAETTTTPVRWVAVERANIRAEGSKSAPVTARLGRGEAVAVLWTEPSGWSRVRIEGDGIDGFIHSSLLTENEPQMP